MRQFGVIIKFRSNHIRTLVYFSDSIGLHIIESKVILNE
jgi:hypothetical protein